MGQLIENYFFIKTFHRLYFSLDFGSKCALGDKFQKDLQKSGIIENVLAWSKFKADMKQTKVESIFTYTRAERRNGSTP